MKVVGVIIMIGIIVRLFVFLFGLLILAVRAVDNWVRNMVNDHTEEAIAERLRQLRMEPSPAQANAEVVAEVSDYW